MTNTSMFAVAGALIVVGAAVREARPLLSREVSSRFPHVSRLAAGTLVVLSLATILVAIYVPVILNLASMAALGVAAASAWVGRVEYGRARGLPPGSLSLTASTRAIVDRRFYRDTAATLGPVFKTAQFHQPTVCVVGLERAHNLLHAHERSLGPSVQRFNRAIPRGFLRYMDAETHGVFGPAFRQALSARVVSHHTGVVAGSAKRVISDAARKASQVGGVQPDTYFAQVTDEAFLSVLFGFGINDADLQPFKAAYAPIARRSFSASPTRATLSALARVREILRARCVGWRARPDIDVPVCALSELAKTPAGVSDEGIPDETALDNLVFIYRISMVNVEGLLRWVLAHLGQHPEWIARLRSELTTDVSSEEPALSDRIIMETLRLSQAEYLYRRLRENVRFEGFLLPKGWLLRLCIWESHRSAETFADPDRFDPDRFLRDQSRTAYMPFGGDRHACNGVPLAYLVCRTFLDELTREYDWSATESDGLEREFRHWSHWRPSRLMRLHLTPRRAASTAGGRAAH